MRTRILIYFMVTIAGAAALAWELLWHLQAALSLGISALGTAITLAATMAGMTVGAIVAGNLLTGRQPGRPLRIYGAFELVIGLSGLFLLTGFEALERVDVAVYALSPLLAPVIHVLGIVLLLGVPTLAMGATLPVFGLVARAYGTSIAMLYGLNTVGAAFGVLAMAFVVVPLMGVSATVRIVASLNLFVAAGAFLFPVAVSSAHESVSTPPRISSKASGTISWPLAMFIVFTTGAATFALEVAWFRAMRAAFMSTTKSFAIMLAAVLIPLAISSCFVPWLRRRGVTLGPFLIAGAVATLIATPVMERMDLLCITLQRGLRTETFSWMMLSWLGMSLVVIGPAILFLSVALPWFLHGQSEPRRWGGLYAVNTVGAILGAIGAAWVLLPTIGFARTSWLMGILVGLVALAIFWGRVRWIGAPALVASIAVAILFESGLGRLRVQGQASHCEVLAYEESRDATVSVIEVEGEFGARELIIDGCHAASEHERANYMTWMGKLPMLAHADPERALVLCFGSGQTANAVRREEPRTIDLVELSPVVYEMAHHFKSNENVLEDARVRAIVMDGRAWLRRCSDLYDVVTLEPMPPYFANSNALYSKEFYELIAARLTPDGVVAQWLPFHMLTPYYATSVAATFTAMFPRAILWVDPESGTGILVGRKNGESRGSFWPGRSSRYSGSSINDNKFLNAVALDAASLDRYAALGDVITDDNQLLSYGDIRDRMLSVAGRMTTMNLRIVKQLSTE